MFSCLADFFCLSNFCFSLRWEPTKQRGYLGDVCFYSPNSQKAVQILPVSSKAQNRAGLALQRLNYSACLRPWRQNAIMQNLGFIMLYVMTSFLPLHCVIKKMEIHRSSGQRLALVPFNRLIGFTIQRDIVLECTDKLERSPSHISVTYPLIPSICHTTCL